MSFQRIDRISEEVRREVDLIIRGELHDPRIKGTYSITRADVTRDLRYAKIYISILEQADRVPMMAALKKAAGYVRHELGKASDRVAVVVDGKFAELRGTIRRKRGQRA